MSRIGARDVQVGVAEPAVELHRQRLARLLVRFERGDNALVDPLELEAGSVGGDRLQSDEPVCTRVRDLVANDVELAFLCDALDA